MGRAIGDNARLEVFQSAEHGVYREERDTFRQLLSLGSPTTASWPRRRGNRPPSRLRLMRPSWVDGETRFVPHMPTRAKRCALSISGSSAALKMV